MSTTENENDTLTFAFSEGTEVSVFTADTFAIYIAGDGAAASAIKMNLSAPEEA